MCVCVCVCVCVCMYVYNTASALLYNGDELAFILAENKTGQLLGATLFSYGETFIVSDPILYLSLSPPPPLFPSLPPSLSLSLSPFLKLSIFLSSLFF